MNTKQVLYTHTPINTFYEHITHTSILESNETISEIIIFSKNNCARKNNNNNYYSMCEDYNLDLIFTRVNYKLLS